MNKINIINNLFTVMGNIYINFAKKYKYLNIEVEKILLILNETKIYINENLVKYVFGKCKKSQAQVLDRRMKFFNVVMLHYLNQS